MKYVMVSIQEEDHELTIFDSPSLKYKPCWLLRKQISDDFLGINEHLSICQHRS